MITREASKIAIGRCKGMDGLSLSEIWIETDDRVSYIKRVSRLAFTD